MDIFAHLVEAENIPNIFRVFASDLAFQRNKLRGQNSFEYAAYYMLSIKVLQVT